MTQVLSIKDTRNKLADVINQVAVAGDTFVITKFGQPKAMIVPIENRNQALIELDEVFGAWKKRKDIRNSGTWVRNMRTYTSLRKKDE